MIQNNFLCIGEIIGVHGIRGIVKVRSYSESPIFMPNTPMLLKTPDGNHCTYTIEDVQLNKRQLLIRLSGVADRNAAESLVGSEFLIPRSALPEPEDGSYYWVDIIGLNVHTEDGRYLGKVDSIFPTGAHDVYVIKEGTKELLIPALDTVILSIALKEGKMIVNLPEGLE